jgi:hypothetical protein
MPAFLLAALSFIPGGKLVTKLLVLGGTTLFLLTLYGVWHHHVWRNGYDDALAAIAKQDSKAIATAQKYRAAVRACSGDGMQWDQSTGKCVRR